MYTFKPLEDHQIEDLSKEENIDFLISKIAIGDDLDILLDIRKCYIDYPTTGVLMEVFLNDLKSKKGNKNITLYYDYHLPEYDLLACLFDECAFFGSKNFRELEYNQVLELINSKAKESFIIITISLYKIFSQEIKHLRYGS